MRDLLRRHWIDGVIVGLLFTLSLAVYNATLTPSLSYKSPDGNELATVPYILGLAHSTGYPLYTWLGKLFTFLPVGDVAHRMNLMSAVLGAAGVATLYLILRLLLGRVWRGQLAAGFTALLFAFSRSFWSQTGIAEVYASNLFMVALTLLLLLLWARVEERDRAGRPAGESSWRRSLPSGRSLALLFLAALALGLSLGTHMSSLGFAPAIALFVLLISWPTALSPVAWAAGGLGFGLGALQFLWLPYKASILNDRLMLGNAPTTWRAFYNYTLGAFPQFKFAFGWAQVPDRIVIYLGLLVQQFGLPGTLLGLLGMWVALWRRPKRFFLIMGCYLVHVIFFTQYAVFDLDVFFIPAHFLFALFVAFGLWAVLEGLAQSYRWLASQVSLGGGLERVVRAALIGVAALFLLLGVVRQLRANWEHNDYSADTAINDFYENVFALLPPDSALLGRGGVFGYDMFYYRLVYDLRPDVLIPQTSDPDLEPLDLAERLIYSNERLAPGARRNPWSVPPEVLPADAWYIPLLLGPTPERHGLSGGRGELVLWRVSDSPPELLLPAAEAAPQHPADIVLDGKRLVGYDLDLDGAAVQAGRAVHLRLYWEITRPGNQRVSLGLAGETLLNYQVGFGNLQRVAEMKNLTDPANWILVDDFWLVVPRTAAVGTADLSIGDAPPLQIQLDDSAVDSLIPFAELEIGEAAPFLNWE
jgi:hypothetical protein